MLNNLLGFSITADDEASLNIMRVAGSLGALKVSGDSAATSFDTLAGRMRDATSGRFVRRPEGVLNPQFLGEVKGELQQLSVAALGFGTAIFGGLGFAAHEAGNFATAVAKVATIADAAEFPLSKIRDIGFQMGEAYGGDLTTQLDALYSAIGSGASKASDAIDLMNASNKLAIGGLTSVDVAMNGLMGTLNAYGMAYSKATEVTDAFFQSVMLGGSDMSVSTLANGLGNITPLASAMNVSLDEMLGGLARLTAMGQKTDIAITNLKGAMEVFLKPNADAVAEAKRLNIAFDQNALKAKGFLGMIKEITTSTKYNAETMTKLFGQSTTGLAAMLALSQNGGAEFSAFMDDMAQKTGKAEFAFKTLAETGQFAQSILKTNLQSALVKIGDAIAPIIGAMAVLAYKVVKAFNEAGPIVHKLTAYIGVAAGAFLFLIGGIAGSTAAIAGIILAGKALLIGLAVVAAGATLALAALVPLIAFGTMLYAVWTRDVGGIATSVKIWFDRIKLAAQALIQVFTDGGFSGAVQQELQKTENAGIKQFAINAFLWFSRIKNFVMGVGEAFSTGLDRVAPIFEKIISAVQRLVGRMMPVKESFSSAKETFDAFGGAGKKTGDFLVTVVEKIATGVLGLLNFIDGVYEAWVGFRPVVYALWDAAKGLFVAFGQLWSAFNGGKASAQDTADFWRTIGNVLGWVATAGVYYVAFGFRMLGGIIGWVAGLIGALVTFFQGLVQGFVTGVQIMIALFKGDWQQVWKLSQKWIEDWAATIVNMFVKVVAGAAGMADSLGKLFGKDLGFAAKVEGFGKNLVSGSSAPTAVQPNGGALAAANLALPAVAQAQGQAQNTAALTSAVQASNQKPIDLTLKSQLNLDGQQIHEATQKASVSATGRAFAPTGDGHVK